MHKLPKIKTPDEVKIATPTVVRGWYNELAKEFNGLTSGKILMCPKCGQYYFSDAFYADENYASGKFYMCKKCIQNIVEQRTSDYFEPNETKESVQEALKLMDLPYIDELYEQCAIKTGGKLGSKNRKSPFFSYIVCVKTLSQYKGCKWKDSKFPDSPVEATNIDPKIIDTFGKGFSDEDYEFLEAQYNDWTARTQVDTKSQEMYVVQICLQTLEIQKDRQAGKDVTNKLKALDVLMNAANLQPKQNVNNAATDSLTFGQLIEKWEEEKPIPEPSAEFKDCDGIGHYIRVWFTGHLAKMLGLKNAYSKEYEDEIAKYTVKKSQSQEEGRSEEIYEAMFGKSGD